MQSEQKVSLQISLSPGDYPHAVHILPHQLSILAKQVDEIILTIDTKPSKGRFAQDWYKYKDQLDQFLAEEIQPLYPVKIIPVNYSPQVKEQVAQCFFGTNNIPYKDFRGGPFYAYFFGLYAATNNFVLHLDSDIFLGGGSQRWINESVQLFEETPSCLFASPLPGPPRADGQLTDQHIIRKIAPYTYSLQGMSTRIFMTDKSKFKKHKLSLSKPSSRNQIKAFLEGNPNADLPEHLFSAFMEEHQLERIDFSGSGDGMWSLHPPYRTKAFYNDLPALIKRIIQNNLPEKQQGYYDIIDEVCNWDEARQLISKNRWWKRLLKN